MKYKIIDNALPQQEFKKIKDLLLGFYFPWFYNPSVSQKTAKDGFYFNHVFFGVEPHKINSDHFDVLQPILNLLKPINITILIILTKKNILQVIMMVKNNIPFLVMLH